MGSKSLLNIISLFYIIYRTILLKKKMHLSTLSLLMQKNQLLKGEGGNKHFLNIFFYSIWYIKPFYCKKLLFPWTKSPNEKKINFRRKGKNFLNTLPLFFMQHRTNLTKKKIIPLFLNHCGWCGKSFPGEKPVTTLRWEKVRRIKRLKNLTS